MRKLIFAKIEISKFQSVGSMIETELNKLVYAGNVVYENKEYYLVGKASVKAFCLSLNDRLNEIAVTFKDAESVKEIENDRQLLNVIFATKAT